MLCPPAVSTHSHEQAATEAHHGHDMADEHQHSTHGADEAQHHHYGAGHDKCSLCSSCCSMVPLMSTFANFPQPFDATEQFPELSVLASSFVSDGQERPPRSV